MHIIIEAEEKQTRTAAFESCASSKNRSNDAMMTLPLNISMVFSFLTVIQLAIYESKRPLIL